MTDAQNQADVSLVSAAADTFRCPRCSMEKPVNPVDSHICEDCAKAENNRLHYSRQHQDWLPVAREAGIDPWLQQPGETQWEYTIWCAYRDSYPGKRPTYGDVARQLDTTYSVVKRVSQRWTFPLRMQLWMKHVDDVTMLQRRDAILEMNKKHIEMAGKINEKLERAIDKLRPEDMKPGEIVQLAKLSAELERQARVDTIAQDELRGVLVKNEDNPDLKKAPTKQGDLKEVVEILAKAGALGEITAIGVKQTTEVVMRDDSGRSATTVIGELDAETE